MKHISLLKFTYCHSIFKGVFLLNQSRILRFGHVDFEMLLLRPVLFSFSQIKF